MTSPTALTAATMAYYPATTNQATWQTWNSAYTTGNTVTVVEVWGAWNQTYTQTIIQTGNLTYQGASPAEIERTEVDLRARWKADEEKKAAAKAKARRALLDVLAPSQREQYERDGHFDLQVNERLYRVRPGRRVERLDPVTKKAQSLFCIHPAESLPAEDVAISQKLLLEANEAEFLRLANESRAA